VNLLGMVGRAGSGKDTVADILVRDHGWVKVACADPLKRICRDVFALTDAQLWGPSGLRDVPDHRYPRGAVEYRDAYDREMRDALLAKTPEDAKFHRELAAHYEREGWLTPRHALQQLGSDWGRRCYPNVWIAYAMRVADAILSPGANPLDPETFEFTARYDARVGLCGRAVPHERACGVVISDVRFPNEVAAIRAKGGQIWKTVHGAGLTGAAGAHESESHIDSIEADAVVPDSTLAALPGVVGTMLATAGLYHRKKHKDTCAKIIADRAYLTAEFDGQHPDPVTTECDCGVTIAEKDED